MYFVIYRFSLYIQVFFLTNAFIYWMLMENIQNILLVLSLLLQESNTDIFFILENRTCDLCDCACYSVIVELLWYSFIGQEYSSAFHYQSCNAIFSSFLVALACALISTSPRWIQLVSNLISQALHWTGSSLLAEMK